MRRMLVSILLCLSVSLLGGEFRLPLVSFSGGIKELGLFFNPWGGLKKGTVRYDSRGNYVELRYEKSSCTLSMAAVRQSLSGISELSGEAKFYLKYRVESMEGSSKVEFVANGSFSTALGLRRSGQWETATVQPGGWNRQGHDYEAGALQDIHLGLHGTGVIQLAELGLVYGGAETLALKGVPLVPCAGPTEANHAVQIDGRLTPQEWADAFSLKTLPLGKDPDNPTSVMVKTSEEGILFGAVCRKKNMGKLRAWFKQNTPEIWQDESIEFYVHDFWGQQMFRKVAINANGCMGIMLGATEAKVIKTAVKTYHDRWEVEVMMPWRFLKMDGARPPIACLNVTRNCYDDQLTRTGWGTLVWNDLKGFVPFAFRPFHGEKSGKARLVHLAQATYVLELPPHTTEDFEVHVSAPDRKHYVFRKPVRVGTRHYLPIRVPLTDSGCYRVLALAQDDRGIRSATSYKVNETLPSSVQEIPYDGYCIFPRPKSLTLSQNSVRLDRFTGYRVKGRGLDYAGHYFAREIEAFYGVSLRPVPQGNILFGLGDEPEVKFALQRLDMKDDYRKIKHDGFLIAVTEEEIVVAARVPAGVLYGAHVLADMVKMSTGEVGDAVIRTVRLVDWPRIQTRVFHQMQNSYAHMNKYHVPTFNRLLERFPIAGRFNAYCFELANYYQWQDVPIRASRLGWSPKELEQVVDFVNANGLTVLPCVQSHGHMAWWLFGPKGQLQELREDGCDDVICTRHPKTYPTLFALYDEYNRVASRRKEYAPKFFYAGFDEVRWKTAQVPEEERCQRCKGIPKNQLFVDHIKALNNYLNSKGQRMIMCTDMIVEAHNGLNAFRCAETADQIPKNVILAHWSSLDVPTMEDFAKKGYENWKLLTGYQEDRVGENVVKGYGMAMYTYNWWLTRTRCQGQGSYTILPQRLIMDFAWNSVPEGTGIWKRRVHEFGKFLMHLWSRKPLPCAGRGLETCDLSGVAKTPATGVASWMGEGEDYDLSQMDFSIRELAGIPVKFCRKQGIVHCVKAGDVQVLPLEKKVASLILLHGASLRAEHKKTFFSRASYGDPTFGPVIANYDVIYDDGTRIQLPIRFGWNVADWRTGDSRGEIFSRYVGDCRWLWEGRTPYSISHKGPEDVVLYQYEWVNPHPHKRIKELNLHKIGIHVDYALLAMTARKAAED